MSYLLQSPCSFAEEDPSLSLTYPPPSTPLKILPTFPPLCKIGPKNVIAEESLAVPAVEGTEEAAVTEAKEASTAEPPTEGLGSQVKRIGGAVGGLSSLFLLPPHSFPKFLPKPQCNLPLTNCILCFPFNSVENYPTSVLIPF